MIINFRANLVSLIAGLLLWIFLSLPIIPIHLFSTINGVTTLFYKDIFGAPISSVISIAFASLILGFLRNRLALKESIVFSTVLFSLQFYMAFRWSMFPGPPLISWAEMPTVLDWMIVYLDYYVRLFNPLVILPIGVACGEISNRFKRKFIKGKISI